MSFAGGGVEGHAVYGRSPLTLTRVATTKAFNGASIRCGKKQESVSSPARQHQFPGMSRR